MFFPSLLELIAEWDQDYGAHVLITTVGNSHKQDCPTQGRMNVTLVKVAHGSNLRGGLDFSGVTPRGITPFLLAPSPQYLLLLDDGNLGLRCITARQSASPLWTGPF